jgi:hypothetical protein
MTGVYGCETSLLGALAYFAESSIRTSVISQLDGVGEVWD